VPVAFISGDSTTVAQTRKLLTHIEGVAVKEPIGRLAARSQQPVEARRRIKEGATRALRRVKDLKPLVLPKPVALEVEWMYTAMADRSMLIPGLTRVGPRTVSYKARDVEQAFSLFLACLVLARSTL
jgi:D-amino peptidase